MIKIYKNSTYQKKLNELEKFTPSSWISVVKPSEEEKNQISELLELSPDIIEDSLDEYELPRVKIVNDKIIVILRAVAEEGKSYTTTPFTIILSHDYITTIALKEFNLLNDLVSQKIDFVTTQRSNFLIKICLRIIEYYQRYTAVINRNVQRQKTNLSNVRKGDVTKLVVTEEILNIFLSSLSPTINVIKKMLNQSLINLYTSDKELVNDLLVDGEQVQELVSTNLKSIRNIRDGYTTVMSINLNRIIEILTFATVVLTIPTIISSLFGMNVGLPFEKSPYAFLIVMLLIFFFAGVAGVLLRAWRKRI